MPSNKMYLFSSILTFIFLSSLFTTVSAQPPPPEDDCRYCHENMGIVEKIFKPVDEKANVCNSRWKNRIVKNCAVFIVELFFSKTLKRQWLYP